jgi:large subunit ribosomal protein L20
MPRARRIPASLKRRKKYLKRAKGFVGGRRKLYRTAKETVTRAMAFATRARKQKKRTFRNLWIIRINAACRKNGISYSKFVAGLKKGKIELNRKSLAEIAARDSGAFKELVALAKKDA